MNSGGGPSLLGWCDARGEEGYLKVILKGLVTLDGVPVGSFSVNEEALDIDFNKGAADLSETLEFAAEQGMILALAFDNEQVTLHVD